MEVVPRKKYACKYPGCNNAYYAPGSGGSVKKHFFKFPRDPPQKDAWKKNCSINLPYISGSWRICEDHFDNSAFINEEKKRLNPGAIPVSARIEDSSGVENLPLADVGNVMIVEPVASTSGTQFFSDLQDSEVISNTALLDHTYWLPVSNEAPLNTNKFVFLDGPRNEGILGKIGLSKKNLNPSERTMHTAYRHMHSRVCKLKTLLQSERAKVKTLQNLYNAGKFQFITENLNVVTEEFINSQLRNADRPRTARTWTQQDKAFALSIYKRSPRLYKFLQAFFQLPSSRTLKTILSQIPFETGINPAILGHLKKQVQRMKSVDRNCCLLFDEMTLCEGFHYERAQQYISGFEDLGSLGRTNKAANHALVFMVRGIRKPWKQVVAYYFTVNAVSANNLKFLIEEIITELLHAGLNVVGTVCDQGTTNVSALSQLCAKHHPQQSSYYFFVQNKPIVTIFDVPHLLKNTRNALLKCKIQFAPRKYAKFEHIQSVFNFDQQKTFKSLPKLKTEHFNFKDSYVKMKVKVAAAQLSSSVASAIETFVSFGHILPSDAIFTAEFVQQIDNLFDSLNSSGPSLVGHKPYRCALTHNSPHLDLWKKLLMDMDQWKFIDLETDNDLTNRYAFVRGWQTTIRSIIFLWHNFQNVDGFDYINLRNFNQDPVENLFSCIRQHGAANTNPTCHQFTAALKTVVINKFVLPLGPDSNCEDDMCAPLEDLMDLVQGGREESLPEEMDVVSQDESAIDLNLSTFDALPLEDTQALAYVSGWVLKNIAVPDCGTCHNILYSAEVTSHHLLTSFKEYDSTQRLRYPSEHVMSLVQNIHEGLYQYLDSNGFQRDLEVNFKNLFKLNVDLAQVHCSVHNYNLLILDRVVPFLIFKFCKDKQRSKQKAISDGHVRRMQRLKNN